MSRSRLLRRFVVVVAVGAVALLGPHTIMSKSATPDSCAAKRHGCGLPALSVSCCCAGQALPDGLTPPSNAAAPVTQLLPVAAPAAAVLPAVSPLEPRLASAPAHGFCTTDLPILLSTLLI
jgi:hypothetical protein